MYMYVRMCIGNGSPTRVSVLLTLAHLQAVFSIWGEGGGQCLENMAAVQSFTLGGSGGMLP